MAYEGVASPQFLFREHDQIHHKNAPYCFPILADMYHDCMGKIGDCDIHFQMLIEDTSMKTPLDRAGINSGMTKILLRHGEHRAAMHLEKSVSEYGSANQFHSYVCLRARRLHTGPPCGRIGALPDYEALWTEFLKEYQIKGVEDVLCGAQDLVEPMFRSVGMRPRL